MGWYTNTQLTDMLNSLPREARGGNPVNNIASQSQHQILSTYPGQICSGIVTRASAGTYDVSVRAPKTQLSVTCNIVCDQVSSLQGVSDCAIPIEGTDVLVFIPYPNANYGIIIGVIPGSDRLSPLSKDNKMPQSYIHLWDCEPGATAGTEAAYTIPYADPSNPNVIQAHNGRPNDIFPGNRAWINEQGVGMAVLNLLLSLKGSDRARIDLSCMDDAVRLISGYYRHINAIGEDQIYNDGGRLTQETYGTPNQWEKDGQSKLGTELWKTEESDPAYLGTALTANVQPTSKEVLASKKRFQIFTGYLGDLVNLFVAIPDPNVSQETVSNDSNDQGVLHTHIDSTGRLQVRSAAGLSFERCDRIPVPKKKHEPWDPEGDKMEDIDTVESKDPYIFDPAYPGARSLQLQNAMAWRTKQAYQRLHEQSQSSNRKDYYLPEEEDTVTPSDTVDEVNKITANFKDNANRRSHISLEDDGSIILRDAWGSEIIMGYGGITINCAGNISLRSGQSTVVLAGKDFIGKAKECLELSTTDKDIRIKAEKNLQMYGKGILVQSSATSESASAENPTGIILNSPNARILAAAKKVHLAGRDNILIDGKDDDGNVTGRLYTTVREFVAVALGGIRLISAEECGLMLSESYAYLVGKSAALVGDGSVAVLRGSKAWVPLQEIDVLENAYDKLSQVFESQYAVYIEGNSWLAPFTPSNRYNVQFKFRTSEDYGTVKSVDLNDAKEFHVYQASWACLAAQKQSLLAGIQVTTWKEVSVNDTFPWPGAEICEGESGYVKVDPESGASNIGDFSEEVSKIRKEVKSSVKNLKAVEFNEYEVVQSI